MPTPAPTAALVDDSYDPRVPSDSAYCGLGCGDWIGLNDDLFRAFLVVQVDADEPVLICTDCAHWIALVAPAVTEAAKAAL